MFYIRADANEIIGTGHIMRCLSIAEEMRRQGEDVTFIIADERPEKMIVAKGFHVICLHSVWDDLEQETDELIRVIRDCEISILLVDTYFVTKDYLKALQSNTKIVYIDDLNNFIYPVDYLINYNIYADDLHYQKRYKKAGMSQTKFILGTGYVPLRSEFSDITRVITGEVSKVLITSGGTDNYNVVGNILEQLEQQIWFFDLEYYVILGRFNISKSQLEEKWKDCSNIHLLSNVNNMVDYMRLCDIAITAGGVTTYEICACGIPAIMYTLADNQLQIAKSVSKRKLIPWVGDVRTDMNMCMQRLVLCLDKLLKDVNLRRQISCRMQSLVDRNGCKKLVELLLNDYK